MGICEQIKSFAEASFILMILKRLNANVIPNQLFHDLQATFQDAIFCCSKLKLLCPSLPLYLVRNGTDPLERYFGNVRIVNHNNSIDYLEFLNSSSAVKGIDFMINDKHVTWGRGKGKVSSRLCLDFSNIRQWDAEKLKLQDVDVASNYEAGIYSALSISSSEGYRVQTAELKASKVTLMKPNGAFIGVSVTKENEEEFEVEEPDETIEIEAEEQANLCDYINSPAIDIDGRQIYKATVVKQMYLSDPLSKDRLRRVQGLTYEVTNNREDMSVDNTVYIGDPLLVKPHAGDTYIANIVNIKIAQKKVQSVAASLIGEDSTLVLDVKRVNIVASGDKLFWDGSFQSDTCEIVSGKYVITVKPDIVLDPPDGLTVYSFDKQLILDLGIQMVQELAGEDANEVRKRCFTCNQAVSLEKMRSHVTYHILSGLIENVCGYCGQSTCHSILKKPDL